MRAARAFQNAALLSLAAALAAPAHAAEDPAFGYWLVESGRAIIEVESCGEAACGRIAWLANPTGPDGAPARDRNNSDPALKDRPVCGMSMMSGFTRKSAGVWRDGEIYNGEDGETYSARFEVTDGGDLKVRGYVGVPILGKSQKWTRVPDDRGGCVG